jgi:hypothetical protein
MSRIISQDRLLKDVLRVLNNPLEIPEISTQKVYARIHDDHDGTYEGKLMIFELENGDMVVTTDKHQGSPLRFRNYFGGGQSLRVHNALKILALAIKLDNDEHPQR